MAYYYSSYYNTQYVDETTILDFSSDEIQQPENITTTLFPHQKKAIKALAEIENTHKISRFSQEYNFQINLNTNICIYADKVGAGKTLTILSLIEYNKSPKHNSTKTINTSHTSNTNFQYNITYTVNINNVPKSNLIIVPHGLVNQWKKHLDMNRNKDYKIINKTKLVDELEMSINHTPYDLPEIILISYTMFKKADIPRNFNWKRIIIDEPQTMTYSNRLPNASFLWLICATPKSLRASGRQFLRDLLPRCYYRNHGLSKESDFVDMITIKNKDSIVDLSIKLPPYIEVSIKCKCTHACSQIKEFLPATALTALRADDIPGAIASLQCNYSDSTTNIIGVLIQNLKDQSHNIISEITHITNMRGITNSERENRLQIQNEKLKKINTKINSIIERVSDTDKICPICLDNVNTPIAITDCCQHSFCFECILMALNKSKNCPMCKTPNCDKSLHVETDQMTNQINKDNELKQKGPKTKLDTLIDLIKNNLNNNSRYLIFSEYSFEKISYGFNQNDIKFSLLQGRIEHQQKIIEKYKKGDIQILLLNAQHFGAGLDLQMSTDIIIFHKFRDNNLRTQVIGRAQRIGRTSQLKVHQLY